MALKFVLKFQSMRINAVIIDDEVNNVEALNSLLNYIPEIAVSGKFTNPDECLQYINNQSVDILFIDIEMPKLSGFDLVERITGKRPHIVFVTAHSDAAVKAFRINAADFLVKPIIFAELRQTIDKITRLINNHNSLIDNRISFTSQAGVDIVEINDILYFMGTGSYSEVHLTDKRKLLVSRNLGEFESLSILRDFLRIHTSYLVNPRHVKKYIKEDGGSLILDNDVSIPVSRRKKEELLQWLKSMQGDN